MPTVSGRSDDGLQSAPVAAGIVLYRPDPVILGRLLATMSEGGRRIFAFANGPLASDARPLLDGRPNLRLLESASNVGLAAGLNAVVRAAGEEGRAHIILFDQDSEPAADLPEQLMAHWFALEAGGDRPAAVGPRLLAPEGFRPIRYDFRKKHGRMGASTLAAVEFLPTSGSLVGLDAFRAVGPFRDDFFIDGIDVEWGLRAWAHGRSSYLARDVVMPHRWGEPANTGRSLQIARQPPLRTYYYVRNTVAVMRLPHTPHRWRLKSAARLAFQAAHLIWHGRRGPFLAAFARGAAHGLTGRRGPAVPGQASGGSTADAA